MFKASKPQIPQFVWKGEGRGAKVWSILLLDTFLKFSPQPANLGFCRQCRQAVGAIKKKEAWLEIPRQSSHVGKERMFQTKVMKEIVISEFGIILDGLRQCLSKERQQKYCLPFLLYLSLSVRMVGIY